MKKAVPSSNEKSFGIDAVDYRPDDLKQAIMEMDRQLFWNVVLIVLAIVVIILDQVQTGVCYIYDGDPSDEKSYCYKYFDNATYFLIGLIIFVAIVQIIVTWEARKNLKAGNSKRVFVYDMFVITVAFLATRLISVMNIPAYLNSWSAGSINIDKEMWEMAVISLYVFTLGMILNRIKDVFRLGRASFNRLVFVVFAVYFIILLVFPFQAYDEGRRDIPANSQFEPEASGQSVPQGCEPKSIRVLIQSDTFQQYRQALRKRNKKAEKKLGREIRSNIHPDFCSNECKDTCTTTSQFFNDISTA